MQGSHGGAPVAVVVGGTGGAVDQKKVPDGKDEGCTRDRFTEKSLVVVAMYIIMCGGLVGSSHYH